MNQAEKAGFPAGSFSVMNICKCKVISRNPYPDSSHLGVGVGIAIGVESPLPARPDPKYSGPAHHFDTDSDTDSDADLKSSSPDPRKMGKLRGMAKLIMTGDGYNLIGKCLKIIISLGLYLL